MAYSYLSLRVVEKNEFDRKWNALLQELSRRTITATTPLMIQDGISGGLNISMIKQLSSGGGGTSQTLDLPFLTSIITLPDDGGFRARVIGGFVYQSASAHTSSKTTLEWTHVNTTYPSEDGGTGPWDYGLANGDNWIYLPKELLGENPTSETPPGAVWTDTESDTYKGVTLAYIYVTPATYSGGVLTVPASADITLYHVGNVFMDNNFNIRSSGSIVGYHAEITSPETSADIAFKAIAGADPILTFFKNGTTTNGTFNAIKADYIGMQTDKTTGLEVSLARTAGNAPYSSLKPAYLEMSGTSISKITADATTTTGKIEIDGTSGASAFMECGTDCEISMSKTSGDSIVATVSSDAQLLMTDHSGAEIALSTGPTHSTLQVTDDGDKTVTLTGNGSVMADAAGDGSNYFEAVGGNLSGKYSGNTFSIQQLSFLDASGNPKKAYFYCTTPTDDTDSGVLSPQSVHVCVSGTDKTMTVAGTTPA